jgi:hypothetical protein
MEIEAQLLKEIEKWSAKILEERVNIIAKDERAKNYLKNIDAYIADSQHFLKKGDYIRSFEALIWAWSWMEILKELDVIE